MLNYLKSIKTSRLTRKQTLALGAFVVAGFLVLGLGTAFLNGYFSTGGKTSKVAQPSSNSQSNSAPDSVNIQGNSNTVINNSTITTK